MQSSEYVVSSQFMPTISIFVSHLEFGTTLVVLKLRRDLVSVRREFDPHSLQMLLGCNCVDSFGGCMSQVVVGTHLVEYKYPLTDIVLQP